MIEIVSALVLFSLTVLASVLTAIYAAYVTYSFFKP